MVPASRQRVSRRTFAVVAVTLALLTSGAVALVAQNRREFGVTARRYAYDVSPASRPGTIQVQAGDLVRITFSAVDIPHSFTIDEYRISKRAEPGGKPVTFEFRADRPGSFPIYCDLTIDDRCLKELRGTLVVSAPE